MSSTGKNKKHPAKKINIQHKLFIDNFIDIDNPKTFNNQTQSYAAAFPATSLESARRSASQLMTKPDVQTEMERLIDQIGLESKVRLNVIKDIMTGVDVQETVTTSTDTEGKEYTSTVLKSPTASDKLKSIDILYKVDGTYDKNRVKADVISTELKSIMRRQRKELTGDTGKQGRGK